MPAEPERRAAEAAIGRAAIFGAPPVRAAHCREVPGPQSPRRTKPIDTVPMAAVPIMVKTTRRERFMMMASVRYPL